MSQVVFRMPWLEYFSVCIQYTKGESKKTRKKNLKKIRLAC